LQIKISYDLFIAMRLLKGLKRAAEQIESSTCGPINHTKAQQLESIGHFVVGWLGPWEMPKQNSGWVK
jgi:hypothetical protein